MNRLASPSSNRNIKKKKNQVNFYKLLNLDLDQVLIATVWFCPNLDFNQFYYQTPINIGRQNKELGSIKKLWVIYTHTHIYNIFIHVCVCASMFIKITVDMWTAFQFSKCDFVIVFCQVCFLPNYLFKCN